MPDPRSLYYKLAKCALWATSLVLATTLSSLVFAFVVTGNTTLVHSIISSAQALSCIALGVMSYHLRPERQVQQDE
jgi:hypothetical protein